MITTKLSTAQFRMLGLIVTATDSGAPFIPPEGTKFRTWKFLKDAAFVEERAGHPGLWCTGRGRAEFARVKSGASPP